MFYFAFWYNVMYTVFHDQAATVSMEVNVHIHTVSISPASPSKYDKHLHMHRPPQEYSDPHFQQDGHPSCTANNVLHACTL